ncbi:hypothetical protein K466DRAFT_343596 [Polyporus arcularius HHB13444]|uniref:Uncharacterized protein n=1 Tax=Polyporus arcularius HHB13444 TaxID=1314778 RepID=A0A5C3P679_9APHY|nr:hypothetical protein K466DRAFT_343596 [Polyporus arcularius HHB13444]
MLTEIAIPDCPLSRPASRPRPPSRHHPAHPRTHLSPSHRAEFSENSAQHTADSHAHRPLRRFSLARTGPMIALVPYPVATHSPGDRSRPSALLAPSHRFWGSVGRCLPHHATHLSLSGMRASALQICHRARCVIPPVDAAPAIRSIPSRSRCPPQRCPCQRRAPQRSRRRRTPRQARRLPDSDHPRPPDGSSLLHFVCAALHAAPRLRPADEPYGTALPDDRPLAILPPAHAQMPRPLSPRS